MNGIPPAFEHPGQFPFQPEAGCRQTHWRVIPNICSVVNRGVDSFLLGPDSWVRKLSESSRCFSRCLRHLEWIR